MDNETLKRLQGVEFEILKRVDDFCEKQGVSYSLFAGTALGAVRHKGFIPWDDDVDLAMTRTEFDRFCTLWSENPPDGYYLESILTDERCGTCHAKVRKEGTVFLSDGEIESEGHHGIWVDIFPLDKVSANKKKRAEKLRRGRELVFLTRANVNSARDNFQKRLVRSVFKLIPRALRRKRILRIHRWLAEHMEDGAEEGYVWVDMSTLKTIATHRFSLNLENGYVLAEFGGAQFPLFSEYDSMLTRLYGDYMQLPPESERSNHHPVKIKF